MPTDPLDHLTLRFRGLEITVSVPAEEASAAEEASEAGFEVVGASNPPSEPTSAAASEGPDRQWIEISTALEERTLRASSPESLHRLSLDPLNHLCARLRAQHPIWGPRARIARAFRAGLQARQRLDSTVIPGESPAIPFRNSLYIVLWCEQYPEGFWTETYTIYISEVRRGVPSGCASSMASSSLKPLTVEAVATLAAKVSVVRNHSLPAVWFVVAATVDGGVEVAAHCHIVYARNHGFMIAAPDSEAVIGAFQQWDLLDDPVLIHKCTLEFCSNRGRVVGSQGAILADIPLAHVDAFVEVPTGRAAAAYKDVTVFSFESSDGAVIRPTAKSACDVADQWISGGDMEGETAEDYLTGQDIDPGEEPMLEAPALGTTDAEAGDGREKQLMSEIARLEAELKQARSVAVVPGSMVGNPSSRTTATPARAQSLFRPTETGLSAPEWSKLQQLAEPSPTKSSAMTRSLVPQAQTAEGMLAEIEKEVLEPEDRKWQAHEPGQCRAVLPPTAVRAAVCLGAMWNWMPWVGVVLLAFSAMLHPSEMVALIRRDIVFPRDMDYDVPCIFLYIQNPKTARFARRQHGRIDDEFIIWIVEKLFFHLPLDEKLFPGSISQFRRLWNHVMQRLGIPYKQSSKGATPGVFRGSGATYLYAVSEDVNWIAWRGRWAKVKTLEYYLQEVAAQLLLHQLDPFSREKIRCFDKAAYAVLCSRVLAAQEQRSGSVCNPEKPIDQPCRKCDSKTSAVNSSSWSPAQDEL
eukprot:Skav217934  [mRNA]  locus=scaffold2849:87967:95034:+ [translate_table: standard]